MLTNLLHKSDSSKPVLSARILAWLDLIMGIVLSLGFLFVLFTEGFAGEGKNIYASIFLLAFSFYAGLPAMMSLVFGILSFKYLRKNNSKGVWMSLVPKVISLVIFLFITSVVYDPIIFLCFIIASFLIGYVFFVKYQMSKK